MENNNSLNIETTDIDKTSIDPNKNTNRLIFGVDSKTPANTLLQNNIDTFEWVVRNKIYPVFFGRYISGENCLTNDEINFLHSKGTKIAAIYSDNSSKITIEEGITLAKNITKRAIELGIPKESVIFLEVSENETVKRDFMTGFAKTLITDGFTPGFKANTDAKYTFDREFSRGMKTNNEIFKKCLVWATAPSIQEYNNITTSHIIHPDNWKPYAPSSITRSDIAIWQYGNACHPIEDDVGNLTTFNLNLVKNEPIIIEKMF